VSAPDLDLPKYTDEETRQLTDNLRQIVETIHRGDLRERPLRPDLLSDLHRALFGGVRSHAGRPRAPGFGSDVLRFGVRYSFSRGQVAKALEDCFRRLRVDLGELEANPAHEDYEPQALRLALGAHVEVIRIHPFEDGNGRTARLLLDLLLVRVGLRPIPIELVRAEYITALEAAFEGDDGLLVDCYLRLASDALPSP